MRTTSPARSYAAQCKAREAALITLLADPPSLHLATAVAMGSNPGRSAVAVTAFGDYEDEVPMTIVFRGRLTSSEAAWAAIDYAMNIVDTQIHGRAVTLHTSDWDVARVANMPRYPKPMLPARNEDVRRRVIESILRTGSLVLWTRIREGETAEIYTENPLSDLGELPTRWVRVAQAAARGALRTALKEGRAAKR